MAFLSTMVSSSPLLGCPAIALNTLAADFIAGRGGDERRYATALRECALLLRCFLRSRLTRVAPALAADAEDVVQECLLAIHLKAHTYDAAQPFEPWLYAVGRYKLVDLLRRRQPGRELSLDLLAETRQFTDEGEASEPTSAADLNVLLAQLPERQRRSIELVKLQGCSVNEVAAMTGQSASGVKVNVHRGLTALARRLGTEYRGR